MAVLMYAAVCVLVAAAFIARRFWRLRSVPGPLLASLTDLWRFNIHFHGPVFPTLRKLHQKYGPVVRTGPNTVSISDPALVKTIYDGRGQFKKADSYGPMRVFVEGVSVGSIIDMQDEQQNKAIRRAVGGAFLARNLLEYESDVDSTLSALIERLRKCPIFNLYDTFQSFQLDFLFKIAFSETPAHLEECKDVLGLAKLGNKRVSHWFAWQPVPRLERAIFHSQICGRWLARPSKWVLMGKERLKARSSSSKEPRGRNDLLQKYVDASNRHSDVIRPETVSNLVNSTVSAGADTTAGTMTTIMYFLLKNSKSRDRLLKELHEAKLSTPPCYAEVSKLPYLDAVIKEALRLHPPLAVPLERIVPDEGCTLAGIYLPPKTVVGCIGKLVHLDKHCFGDTPDRFCPERWLVANAASRQAMERGFISWGSGGRICLGRYIAELEMKKVIPSILLNFNMSFGNPDVSLPMMEGVIEFDSNPIMVHLEERGPAEKRN